MNSKTQFFPFFFYSYCKHLNHPQAMDASNHRGEVHKNTYKYILTTLQCLLKTVTWLCSHHHDSRNYSSFQIETLYSSDITPHSSSLPQPLATTMLFSVSVNLTTVNTSYGLVSYNICPFVSGLFYFA